MRKLNILLLLNMVVLNATSQSYILSHDQETLLLQNNKIFRTFHLPSEDQSFYTTEFSPLSGDFNYWDDSPHPEFSFSLDDQQLGGLDNWKLQNIETATDENKGEGATVILRDNQNRIELAITYLLYPDLPLVRKKIAFKNLTSQPQKLEDVDIERFRLTNYVPLTYSWVISDYGRRRHLGPYKGNMFDVVTLLHNMDSRQGILVGNEAPGVLKRTTMFWDAPEITTGLSHAEDRFPFRRWLSPGQTWETPPVFTMVYNNYEDPDQVLNRELNQYLNYHLGTRLSQLTEKPTFVYNTWEPFNKNINEKLVMELAKAAADAGMKEFVIDDGWNDNYGDWTIDKEKFPNGFKPIFDYIKSLDMKPGLWMSVGSASIDSKVFQEHPEYFVLDKQGNFTSLHAKGVKDKMTACFATGWYDHIKEILLKMINDYGLEYLKLDFAVVTSPYMLEHEHSGCYAENHPLHKDRPESFLVLYDRVWQLFDELHEANEKLFIDCTFETMGGMQLIDYAMLKHAEGNWLANYNAPAPDGSLRVRNMAWWRSPAIPATALVIGNTKMSDERWDLNLKSVAGALPIMLGDPRSLSEADKQKFSRMTSWFQKMQERHDIMSYRQDLPGFGEPQHGQWDGFQRINTQTGSGGIVGIFRHGAREDTRTVTVDFLQDNVVYQVHYADENKLITENTGKSLKEKGFEVKLDKVYDGALLEVKKVR